MGGWGGGVEKPHDSKLHGRAGGGVVWSVVGEEVIEWRKMFQAYSWTAVSLSKGQQDP